MPTPDLQSALPDPRDSEPPMLRRDIADELADHLSCAMKRELRRTEDEPVAHQNVLEKFGDPAAVARRLYLDAMKEQIMKDRILLATVVLLTLVSLVSVALAWGVMKQGKDVNTALLAKLDTLGSGAGTDHGWTEVEVKVVQGSETGPPAVGWRVQIVGLPEYIESEKKTDAQGIARIGPIPLGNYQFAIESPSRQGCYTRRWRLGPAKSHSRTIVGPAAPLPQAKVEVAVKWPEDLQNLDLSLRLHCGINEAQSTDKNESHRAELDEWSPYGFWLIVGSHSAYEIKWNQQGQEEERLPLAPVIPGSYKVSIYDVLLKANAEPGSGTSLLNVIGNEVKLPAEFTVAQGQENQWTLNVPDEVVTTVRESLAKMKAGSSP